MKERKRRGRAIQNTHIMTVSGDSTHSAEERKNKPEDIKEIMHVAPVLYFHMNRPWTLKMTHRSSMNHGESPLILDVVLVNSVLVFIRHLSNK